MLQIHAIVSGYVQGVSFRYYTVQHARSLGVKGFVRNIVDSKVEVVAQGSKMQLERMVEWLNNGPASASIEEVAVEWQKPGKKFKGFSVEY